ncbi:MAG: response regulator transcription factor [Hymenobacter sp.]|nr:MAG: response regulator transcription factor [Hymenobacter sp.]
MTELPIRVLVVEDEPLYAEQLEAALEDLGYEFVGPAPNARLALSLHRTETVDIALLDVQLRGSPDGVELAAQLYAIRPIPLIFLTSLADKETFARARLVAPAAYLIKPACPDALQRAIILAISSFAASPAALPATDGVAPASLPDAFFVKENGLLEKIKLSDVHCVEANDKVCHLTLAGRSIPVRLPLRELMQHLPPAKFVQIQRSYFINLDHIVRLDPVRNLVQVGEQLLPISRRYHDELLRRLHLLG